MVTHVGTCPRCSAPTDRGAVFCARCGVRLASTCAACGASLPDGARFCASCGAPGWSPAAPPADRKTVTILFADVVDSTRFAETVNAEEWHTVVGRIHEALATVVDRHEGTVGQLLGDGMLAFFGAPAAHEDDAPRAVRAGLEMIEAIGQLADSFGTALPSKVGIRVGINTGPVVVGELTAASHSEYLAVGDAVNTAARVESLAEPMTVRIALSTYRLVAPLFECRDMGASEVKGKSEAVQTWQVIGARDHDRHQRRWTVRSRFVGRRAELAELGRLSSSVRHGEGAIVVIAGEPGIGKSRLMAEWRALTERERSIHAGRAVQARWLEAACMSNGRKLPYHGLIALATAATRIDRTDPRSAASKLRADLEVLLGDRAAEIYPFLAHLLSLPLGTGAASRIGGHDPRALQEGYVRALTALLRAMASREPLLVLVEDAHWLDQTSAELLPRLFAIAADAPVIEAFTSRPDDESPGWSVLRRALAGSGTKAVRIDLGALSKPEALALADQRLPDDGLLEVRELIVERAAGNPLFVEEIARALVEQKMVDVPVTLDGVPVTLQGLLLERIDRLPVPTRTLLRLASVIGRRFAVRVVERVAAEDGLRLDEVGSGLARLVEAALVQQVPGTSGEFEFRHALIHDAAYEELLVADRSRLHLLVADQLVATGAEELDEVAPTIARHLLAASAGARAVPYLLRGADYAARRFAHAESQVLLEDALVVLQAEPDRVVQTEVHERLGDVLQLVGRQTDSIGHYEAALALDVRPLVRARLLRKRAQSLLLANRNDESLASGTAALDALVDQRAPVSAEWWQEWIAVMLARSWTLYFARCQDELQTVIAEMAPAIERWGTAAQKAQFYSRVTTTELARRRFAPDVEVVALARRCLSAAQESGDLQVILEGHFAVGLVLLLAWQTDEAERELQATVRLARQIGDAHWMPRALSYLAVIARRRGQVASLRTLIDEALAAATEAEMPVYEASALAQRSWLAWKDGDADGVRAYAAEALGMWRDRGSHFVPPFEWYALMPLLACAVASDEMDLVAVCGQDMLDHSQQELRAPVRDALAQVAAAHGKADIDQLRRSAQLVVAEATRAGYV